MTSSAITYISLFWHQQTRILKIYSFCIPCIILFNVYFNTTFHVSLFYCLHLKTDAFQSGISSWFRKRSTIGQLNVHAAKAENEEQYILNNIIYIAFQNCYFFWRYKLMSCNFTKNVLF